MLDFPNTPTDGERSVQPNGVTYEWQATKERWISITTLGGSVVGGTVVQVSTSIIDDYLSQAVAGVSLKSTPLLVTDDAGQWFDVAFTPKYANSVLMFQVAVQCIPLGTEWISTGIFETGGAAEAFGQTLVNTQTASTMPPVAFNTTAPAGSTAPRNYVVRSQCNAATTLFINGRPAAASGGRSCSLIITEIQPNAIVEPILPSPLEIFVNGEPEAASGTSFLYAMPLGVKKFSVSLSNVRIDQVASNFVQLRSGGVVKDTGYQTKYWFTTDGAGGAGAVTDIGQTGLGFGHYGVDTSNGVTGTFECTLIDQNTNLWSYTYVGMNESTLEMHLGSGYATLDGGLDGVLISPTVGGTWESGTINIQYDNQGQEATILAAESNQRPYVAYGVVSASGLVSKTNGFFTAIDQGAGLLDIVFNNQQPDGNYAIQLTALGGGFRMSNNSNALTDYENQFRIATYTESGALNNASVHVLLTRTDVPFV